MVSQVEKGERRRSSYEVYSTRQKKNKFRNKEKSISTAQVTEEVTPTSTSPDEFGSLAYKVEVPLRDVVSLKIPGVSRVEREASRR